MTPVRLLLEAEEELQLAAQYYEQMQPGLGRALIVEVRRTRDLISEYPLSAPMVRGDVRIRSIARFPYRIYYRARPDEIVVIAIGHRRRRPGFWQSRIDG